MTRHLKALVSTVLVISAFCALTTDSAKARAPARGLLRSPRGCYVVRRNLLRWMLLATSLDGKFVCSLGPVFFEVGQDPFVRQVELT